jgi:hypothetical protein
MCGRAFFLGRHRPNVEKVGRLMRPTTLPPRMRPRMSCAGPCGRWLATRRRRRSALAVASHRAGAATTERTRSRASCLTFHYHARAAGEHPVLLPKISHLSTFFCLILAFSDLRLKSRSTCYSNHLQGFLA